MLFGTVIVVLVWHVVAMPCATLPAVQNTTSSAITTKKTEFVSKLQQSLRRNNDDYKVGVGPLPGPQGAPGEGSAGGSSEHSSAYVDDIEEVYRRALRERGTEQGTVRINRYKTDNSSLKLRMARNQNMIDAPVDKMNSTDAKTIAPVQFRADDKVMGPSVKMRGSAFEIPNADQLDMAPAKGSKIASMRNKNRLCQRHVLVPEGPKYDSRGRVYLRAHPPHAERPYAVTRRPRLLLPRCCNCCKKSVLGCE